MEIHKPKPWHGWREFAGEILVIVVGVLIALGAEQAVEALRHHEIVARGENSLKDNFARFLRFTVAQRQEQACLTTRAAELRGVLDQAAQTHRLPRIGPIPQPGPRPWQIDTWEAMVASQAAAYLPNDREVLYSRVAMSGLDVYAVALKEWDSWGALKSLVGPPRPISEAEEARARDTLARAVSEGDLVAFLAANTAKRIKSTGLLSPAETGQEESKGRVASDAFLTCPAIVISDR